MAISTACPNCGKKYRAADNMSGRRVKCRGCGVAFTLTDGPAAAGDSGSPLINASDSDVDVTALQTLSDPFAGLGSATSPTTATGAFASTQASNRPFARDRDRDADSVFQSAFAGTTPRRRSNSPFPYPGSRQLDHWLPILLPIVAFLWVTAQAFISNASGVGWTPVVRVLVLALAFLVIVFPFGWLAVKFAAQQAKFELPPSPRLRVAASMAFALAVTAVLYLSLGSFYAAIPGLILGLIVAIGLVWLLIRIQPAEAGVTLGFVAAAFVGSTLLIAGVLTLANVTTRSILGNVKTQLVESPFGPGLAWDAPPAAKPTDPRRGDGEPVVIADAGSGRTTPSQGEPASNPGTPPPTPPTPTPPTPTPAAPQPEQSALLSPAPPTPTPTPTPGDTSAKPPGDPATPPDPAGKAPAGDSGDKPPGDSTVKPPKPENLFPDSKLFGPGAKPTIEKPKPPPEEEDPDPIPPAVEPPPRPAGPPQPPAQVPPEYAAASGDPVAFSILGAKVSIVTTVRATQTIGTFERIVPALAPSNIALIVKHGSRADADSLESWDLASLKRLAATEVKRDLAESVGAVNGVPSYAASPDGATWARITTFPTLCLEITPLAGNSPPVRLPLKEPAGEATVLGYLSTDRVLVRWRSGENVRLDLWDIKARSQSGKIVLPPHPASTVNGVVSPDGKTFAVVSTIGSRAAGSKTTLSLYDLSSHQTPRTVPVVGVDAQRAVKPSGMAVAPDGSRVGLLYEQNGNTVVLGYRQTPTGLMPTEPLAAPAGKVAPMADETMPAGRLSSVAGGKAWLLGGNVVLDANTGVVLGDFGIEIPCAHLSIGGETLYLSGDPGQRRMTLVKMKEEGKKPATPATRPK